MPRRDRTEPGAARSPLVELEAELRALDRKRLKIVREARASERRFEPPSRVEPGSWADLERTVFLERAA
jgi:hypothetical protein